MSFYSMDGAIAIVEVFSGRMGRNVTRERLDSEPTSFEITMVACNRATSHSPRPTVAASNAMS